MGLTRFGRTKAGFELMACNFFDLRGDDDSSMPAAAGFGLLAQTSPICAAHQQHTMPTIAGWA